MRDIVELTAIGSQPAVVGLKGREQDVDVRSPDGTMTAVVTRKADIARNSNVYTLWLYQTAELRSNPRPRSLLRWESTSNRSAISSLQWLKDSRTLAFLGEQPGELPQVYTVRTDSAELSRRTEEKTIVRGFAIAADDSWLVYEIESPRDDADIERKRRQGFVVPPTMYLGDLLAGDWSGLPPAWSSMARTDLIVARKNEAPRKFGRPQNTNFLFPEIVHDGAHALFRLRLREERYVDLDLRTGEGREVTAEERSKAFPKPSSASKGPRLVLDYRLDRPTQLIALDTKGKHRSVVLNTDAEIASFRLTAVRPSGGPLPNGRRWSGGLYLPADARPGKRHPLVIQTHGFEPEVFAPQGFSPASNAAQPLAARGIAVLQFDELSALSLSDFETPAELPGVMAAYEAAVKRLDELGHIDTSRMGIQGWSRTGQHLYYTLQHSKVSFTAAFVSDAQTGGYFEKVAIQNIHPGYQDEGAGLFGAQPQGEGLRKWAEFSPGFNMDKIDIPIRLEVYGFGGSPFMWEAYSRLLELRKPVEFFVIPHAAHMLVKPLERLASAEAMEDWFAFWLKGEQEPAAEKQAQYRRWEALKELKAKD